MAMRTTSSVASELLLLLDLLVACAIAKILTCRELGQNIGRRSCIEFCSGSGYLTCMRKTGGSLVHRNACTVFATSWESVAISKLKVVNENSYLMGDEEVYWASQMVQW